MCLAIAPNQKQINGIFSRTWQNVSSTPFRLFSFCAFMHSLILGGLLIHKASAGEQIDMYAYMSAYTYGILALLAYGYLLTWIPKKYSQSPVHYGRYNIIYLFMMTALAILELGIVLGNNWSLAGMLLLIPAWLIALQALWNIHVWLSNEVQQVSRVLMLLLSVNFICLCLSILGQFYTVPALTTLATASSTLLIWPLLIAAALILLLTAPAKGRVISQ